MKLRISLLLIALAATNNASAMVRQAGRLVPRASVLGARSMSQNIGTNAAQKAPQANAVDLVRNNPSLLAGFRSWFSSQIATYFPSLYAREGFLLRDKVERAVNTRDAWAIKRLRPVVLEGIESSASWGLANRSRRGLLKELDEASIQLEIDRLAFLGGSPMEARQRDIEALIDQVRADEDRYGLNLSEKIEALASVKRQTEKAIVNRRSADYDVKMEAQRAEIQADITRIQAEKAKAKAEAEKAEAKAEVERAISTRDRDKIAKMRPVMLKYIKEAKAQDSRDGFRSLLTKLDAAPAFDFDNAVLDFVAEVEQVISSKNRDKMEQMRPELLKHIESAFGSKKTNALRDLLAKLDDAARY